MLTQRMLPMYI